MQETVLCIGDLLRMLPQSDLSMAHNNKIPLDKPLKGHALASREQNLKCGRGGAHAAHRARGADREAVNGGPKTQCVREGWWRAIGPVQVPSGKHPPLYPLRTDMREAKRDAAHRGAWVCGCGAAAWERRVRAQRGEAPAPQGGAGG